jgi:T-complex protein 1 subunit zeta
MNSTHSEAEVTQVGQAIRINNNTALVLFSLFSSNIGPYGTYKALISPGKALRISKDGSTLCREIQFSHPTSIVITRAATSLYNTYGDGASSLIALCCNIFSTAFRYYMDGAPIAKITSSLQLCLSDIAGFLKTKARPFESDTLEKMALSLIGTKTDRNTAPVLSRILVQAVENAAQSPFFDISMVEVLKMQEGDPLDTVFVNGLVLDHGGRHSEMPEEMKNVCILITNMSLEYEKPEINAEFCYSSAQQRDAMAAQEREFILKKARAIAEFGKKLRSERGMSLLVVSEKGIDPFSLEVLANAGILALRRAKRRNLERLVRMCGGRVITQLSQLSEESLGFCESVRVRAVGEERFTFIEGTPLKGSCTILVRGNSEHETERITGAIRGSLKSLYLAMKDKVYIEGGINLYRAMALYLRTRMEEVPAKDVVGYRILESSFLDMIKVFLRNSGRNIQEDLARVMRTEEEKVVDNFSVVSAVVSNAVVVAVTLLLVDEIIKAGRLIKDEKPDAQ